MRHLMQRVRVTPVVIDRSSGSAAEDVLEGYFQAKDGDRPVLLDRVFAPDAELVVRNSSANIAFPAVTRGRSAIAEVLVRGFALSYENVYSFYLARPGADVRHFECPWLVGMSERASGLPRVGCGRYAWSFQPDPPHLANALVISIDVMQVAPLDEFEQVFSWLRTLNYPWSSCSLSLGEIPRTESLAPIAAFLEHHAAVA